MFWKRKQALESKEYVELKQLCSSLNVQITSLEVSFTNLTNQVLKKIRGARKKIEEDQDLTGAEEKDNIYKDVFVKEK